MRGRASILASAALLLHLGIAACGGSGGDSNPAGPGEVAAAIVLGGAPTSTLLVGETAQMFATVINKAGSVIPNGQVEWTSSDESVAKVSLGGLVTAVGGGQVQITAKSGTATASSNVSVILGVTVGTEGGTVSVFNSTVTLTVPPQSFSLPTTIHFAPMPDPPSDSRLVPGTAVTIGPQGLTLFGGATLKLKYDKAKLPPNVTQASLQLYAYVSGAWRQIAGSKVDSTSQVVTGVIYGAGTYSVIGTPIARISIAPTSVLLLSGRTTQLTFAAYDAAGGVLAGRAVTWSSSNGGVATVDVAGKVTALTDGTATITATSESVSATVEVIVFPRATDSGTGGTHPAGTIASTLPLSGRPHGVAIATSGQFCVSLIDAASVACGFVSSSAVAMGPSISVGSAPAHVALSADGDRAYTANQFGNSMSIVDLAGSALVATVPLSDGGFNVLADPGSSRVYVTTASGLLHVVDAATRSVVAQVQLGAASNGLALDRAAGRLYVSSISAGTITVVNTATNAIVTTFQVSGKPQRLALTADGKTLLVATEVAGLELLNVSTGARAAVPGVASGAVGLALSPDGARAYVTNPPLGQLQIVDLANLQVTTLQNLGRPRNVAFGLSGAVAIVTGENGLVYVIR